ncbi:MAG: acyl-CoA dehydrogenase [Deltaproteobacteria bacterium]|nr:acyl-CoA dehydrogenase [Deltaproteobacteria bacterium]
MDFGLSDEQKLLQETVRRLLEQAYPTTRAREISLSKSGHDANLHTQLAELGVLGTLVPETHGGNGLSFLDAMLVSEELGRAAAPGAFLSTGVLAALALRDCGNAPLAKEVLPEIAAGRTRFGVGLAESYAARDGAGVRLERGRLEGTALFALDAVDADRLLVHCAGGLALVSAESGGVEIVPLDSVDRTRRICELRLRSAEPTALIEGTPRVLAAGRLALAFDQIGGCTRALELALGYAMERKQFGRVIGSFQAVKHMLSEMAAALEPARSLAWYAAHAFDHEPADAQRLAALAKAHVSEVASEVLRKATEVHGGIGFTEQYDLHLWFRRGALSRQLLGGPELLREEAARLRGWAA